MALIATAVTAQFVSPHSESRILIKRLMAQRFTKFYEVTNGEDDGPVWFAGKHSYYQGRFNGLVVSDGGGRGIGPGFALLTGSMSYELEGGEKVECATTKIEVITAQLDYTDEGPTPVECKYKMSGTVTVTSA